MVWISSKAATGRRVDLMVFYLYEKGQREARETLEEIIRRDLMMNNVPKIWISTEPNYIVKES